MNASPESSLRRLWETSAAAPTAQSPPAAPRFLAAHQAIHQHERKMAGKMIAGLLAIPD